jgi:hypothetical protein
MPDMSSIEPAAMKTLSLLVLGFYSNNFNKSDDVVS